MILIIGGMGSGKKNYVTDEMGYRDENMADGVLDNRPVIYNLQDIIRDIVNGSDSNISDNNSDNNNVNDLDNNCLDNNVVNSSNDNLLNNNAVNPDNNLFNKNVINNQNGNIWDDNLLDNNILNSIIDVTDSPENDESLLIKTLRSKEVVICNEVGSGIIPLVSEDRKWREQTGRICVLLARKAEKVIRMTCGIPTVIKGE